MQVQHDATRTSACLIGTDKNRSTYASSNNSPPMSKAYTDNRPDAAENPGTNLFVTGIAPRIDETELRELFSKYGEVDSVQIMTDPHTRDSRGFGFVCMMTSEQAEAAREGLTGEDKYGRIISVEKARRRRPRKLRPTKVRNATDRAQEHRHLVSISGHRSVTKDQDVDSEEDTMTEVTVVVAAMAETIEAMAAAGMIDEEVVTTVTDTLHPHDMTTVVRADMTIVQDTMIDHDMIGHLGTTGTMIVLQEMIVATNQDF